MRYLLTFLCLLTGLLLPAQSYYVALVKGKVYYEDVLLKPKTKIELKGNFRFTTKEDYLKVSGPNGIHTIRPQEKAGGGYEFVQAVTQELFPVAKPRGSYVLSAWINIGDQLSLYDENHYVPEFFVEGERLSLSSTLKPKDYDKLYWVYQTASGAVHREPARIDGDDLIITPASFYGPTGEAFAVDGKAFLFFLKSQDNLPDVFEKVPISELFWSTNFDMISSGISAKAPPGEYTRIANDLVTPLTKAYFPEIVGLTQLDEPGQVLPAEEVFANAAAFMLSAEMTSIELFLGSGRFENVESYADVLRQQYGEMNLNRVMDAFWYYLDDHREEDARYQAILDGYSPKRLAGASRKWNAKSRKAFYRGLREGARALRRL